MCMIAFEILCQKAEKIQYRGILGISEVWVALKLSNHK